MTGGLAFGPSSARQVVGRDEGNMEGAECGFINKDEFGGN